MTLKAKIRGYALQNAVLHDGKASASAVIGKVIGDNPIMKNSLKEIAIEASKIVNEINSITIEEQTLELKEKYPALLEKKKIEERQGLPELPNVVYNVVVRYAPFPSGPLHIGNVYPAIINDEYRKKYEGRLLLIIDDTIGSEEKQIMKEAYDLIPQGCDFLGMKYDTPIIYKSDRLEIYYDYAEQIIKKEKARRIKL